MAEDYEFNDSENETESHPFDAAEHQSKLRYNRVLKTLFENLEKQPEERMSRFPAWVYEGLADMMAYCTIRESYKNRSPASIEDFYQRQGMIKAYEGLGSLFSQEALNRQEAPEDKGGQ